MVCSSLCDYDINAYAADVSDIDVELYIICAKSQPSGKPIHKAAEGEGLTLILWAWQRRLQ